MRKFPIFSRAAARSLLAASCLIVAPACDDGEDMDSDSETTGTQAPCAEDTRGDTFAVGLARSGVVATVTFLDAMPSPPAKGDNVWHVGIADGSGAPLSDLAIAVVPFMPDHGHGTPVDAVVEPVDGSPGEYMLSDVNMFMAGLWEVSLDMTLPDETTDSVTFKFCVDP